jgi:uncharacterized protein
METTKLDIGAAGGRTPAPYGLVGLGLSLIAAMVLTVSLVAAVIGIAFFIAAVPLGREGARAILVGIVSALQVDNEFSPAQLGLGIFLYAAALAALLLIARWRGGAGWRSLVGWRPPLWPWRDTLLWGLAGLGLLYGLASSAALGYFYPKSNSWLLIPRDHLSAGLLLFLAVVGAPLVEETYFRGWIYTSLRGLGMWPAILTSALLFALAHYESTHLYALAVFPLGIVLAALRERTGSVRTSMLFHAVNNLIAFFSAGLSGS